MKRTITALAAGVLIGGITLGGVSYAATGGSFILGRVNSASSQTNLSNTGSGPVLSLSTRSGQPPLAVSAGSAKAPNLNADKLDGLDSTAFVKVGSGTGGTGRFFADARFVDIDNDGVLDDILQADAQCPAGSTVTGGGFAVFTDNGISISRGNSSNGWTAIAIALRSNGENETDLTGWVQCFNPTGPVSGAALRRSGPAELSDQERQALIRQASE